MPLRLVVIGDQSASLQSLVATLDQSLDLQIVGAFDERHGARVALLEEEPDIALVSADLADGNGFDLIASLRSGERPHAVVFCSAREEDAVRAFELSATDFMTLPLRADRLHDALARARQQALQAALLRTADELQRLLTEVASGAASVRADRQLAVSGARGDATLADDLGWRASGLSEEGVDAVASLLAAASVQSTPAAGLANTSPVGASSAAMFGLSPGMGRSVIDRVLDLASSSSASEREERPSRVLIREGRRTRFVALHEIDWFEADGNYIIVRAGEERYRTRGTVSAIERVLDPQQFVRIHRRIVVNMDRVKELAPLPGGDGMLTLSDGSNLRLSRTYRSRVR